MSLPEIMSQTGKLDPEDKEVAHGSVHAVEKKPFWGCKIAGPLVLHLDVAVEFFKDSLLEKQAAAAYLKLLRQVH
ncbi:hypothetical protein XELAEV_18037229mg [Xenopus laevis]|uniref:Uncharacterized protein n=1 Tax=Xenopus laevis TaxID=8355 RepID=A0A974HAG7_XENLA|nr:hypothetical protein XELAEV_18037229mg [Xenopus laevis]